MELDKCPLDFFRDLFPEGIVTAEGHKKMDVPDWRSKCGIFGITGDKARAQYTDKGPVT